MNDEKKVKLIDMLKLVPVFFIFYFSLVSIFRFKNKTSFIIQNLGSAIYLASKITTLVLIFLDLLEKNHFEIISVIGTVGEIIFTASFFIQVSKVHKIATILDNRIQYT